MFLTAESSNGIQAFLRMMDLSRLDGSVLRIVMAVLAVLAVAIVLMIVFRFGFVNTIRRWIYKYPLLALFAKAFAIVATLALALSDYYAVSSIFRGAQDVDPKSIEILSYTFAAFLEGFAFLLGIFLSKAVDPTCYRRMDRIGNIIGTFLTGIALFVSWGLAIWLRVNSMENKLLDEGVEKELINWSYILDNTTPDQIFMMCSPVLTSILALGLSWMAFPSDYLSDQQRTVEYLRGRYLRFRKRYQKYLLRYKEGRSKLWTTLTSETEAIEPSLPADPDLYQSRCQQMIRQKTVSACVNVFSDEFGRYNKCVENVLGEFIQELSLRSTLPHLISEITVQEVLEQYERELAPKDLTEEFWDNKQLRLSKMERLRGELDNAAHRAEFRYQSRRK